MIAARGPDAFRRGEYYFVLGEMHVALNTLDSIAFLTQHPALDDLFAAEAADMPQPRFFPALGSLARMPKRALAGLMGAKDYRVFSGVDWYDVSPATPLCAGDLIITMRDGELVVATRDGRFQRDILAFFGEYLSNFAAGSHKIMPPAAHTPRVTVDRLVIARESWNVRVADLAFAFAAEPERRFAELRAWVAAQGMPRCMFFRSPLERKPIYIDCASPLLVELLCKAIRACQKTPENLIGFSEMLPAPDETWLPDSAGQRYTCELRMVMVDRAGQARST
jgi:hypothetical protein